MQFPHTLVSLAGSELGTCFDTYAFSSSAGARGADGAIVLARLRNDMHSNPVTHSNSAIWPGLRYDHVIVLLLCLSNVPRIPASDVRTTNVYWSTADDPSRSYTRLGIDCLNFSSSSLSRCADATSYVECYVAGSLGRDTTDLSGRPVLHDQTV